MTEPASDEEDPRLAREQSGLRRIGQVLTGHEIRLRAPALERAQCDAGQVE